MGVSEEFEKAFADWVASKDWKNGQQYAADWAAKWMAERLIKQAIKNDTYETPGTVVYIEQLRKMKDELSS